MSEETKNGIQLYKPQKKSLKITSVTKADLVDIAPSCQLRSKSAR